jgi:chromosome segregation ATPase
MEIIIAVVIAVLGSRAVEAIINAWLTRRKAAADKQLIEAQAVSLRGESERSETAWWQQRVEVMLLELNKLQDEVSGLRAAMDEVKTSYEQRIASLHEKIEHITHELDRANKALDTANKTIAELREIIAELRQEISSLLIKAAKEGVNNE